MRNQPTDTRGPRWVYICHPFSTHGDIQQNYEIQKAIVGRYHDKLDNFTPISPILTFAHTFSTAKEDHHLVMEACLRLLLTCSEIHLYGEWYKSLGCRMELACALKEGIKVYIADGAGNLTPW